MRGRMILMSPLFLPRYTLLRRRRYAILLPCSPTPPGRKNLRNPLGGDRRPTSLVAVDGPATGAGDRRRAAGATTAGRDKGGEGFSSFSPNDRRRGRGGGNNPSQSGASFDRGESVVACTMRENARNVLTNPLAVSTHPIEE